GHRRRPDPDLRAQDRSRDRPHQPAWADVRRLRRGGLRPDTGRPGRVVPREHRAPDPALGARAPGPPGQLAPPPAPARHGRAAPVPAGAEPVALRPLPGRRRAARPADPRPDAGGPARGGVRVRRRPGSRSRFPRRRPAARAGGVRAVGRPGRPGAVRARCDPAGTPQGQQRRHPPPPGSAVRGRRATHPLQGGLDRRGERPLRPCQADRRRRVLLVAPTAAGARRGGHAGPGHADPAPRRLRRPACRHLPPGAADDDPRPVEPGDRPPRRTHRGGGGGRNRTDLRWGHRASGERGARLL
ncbi:MAG: hypothetical protein AVDCRST_MAG49-2988, partial [uncultured Thermomicrobiales bacterium]